MKTKQEIFKTIEIQGQLPTLPIVLTKVLNMLTNPNISVREISKVISTDLSLSSKTLKLVNSAFYGLSKKVATINQAIVILGFNTIKSAVFGTAIIGTFEKYKKIISIDYDEFWKHSVGVGAASRIIAKVTENENIAEEAFIGGIIHDIGKLVLSIFDNEYYEIVIDRVKEKHLNETISDVEREVFDFDHAEIGHYLTEKWNFPKSLTDTIKYHHKLEFLNEDNSDKILISIVSIANILVNILELGESGSYYINQIPEENWKLLNLDTINLHDLYKAIIEEYKSAIVILG